jgi:hypothetical protein
MSLRSRLAVRSAQWSPPGPASYHLALSDGSTLLYNFWNGPGSGGTTAISALPITDGGGLSVAGTPYTVVCDAGSPGCSTDVRGVAFNYYGTAPGSGTGDFRTVVFNGVTNVATLAVLKAGLPAHGLSFDPFTKDVTINSANTVDQLDAAGNTTRPPKMVSAIFSSPRTAGTRCSLIMMQPG